jgi:copper chaperone CopZ
MSMTTVTYFVPNINCGHCVRTIQNELSDLSGVTAVEADQQSRQVKVNFGNPATTETIESLLAEINYPAESKVG